MMLMLGLIGCPKYEEPCCVIGEGPWDIYVDQSRLTSSLNLSAQIWAHSSDPDSKPETHDWNEYLDKEDANFVWLSPGHTWFVRTSADEGSAGGLDCGSENNKCEKFTALAVPKDPGAILLEKEPPASGVTTPQYHAPGRYKITMTKVRAGNIEGTATGLFYTVTNATGGRDEAFCRPAGWSWPRREQTSFPTKPGVEWQMEWDADATAVPATLSDCPATQTWSQLDKYQVTLG